MLGDALKVTLPVAVALDEKARSVAVHVLDVLIDATSMALHVRPRKVGAAFIFTETEELVEPLFAPSALYVADMLAFPVDVAEKSTLHVPLDSVQGLDVKDPALVLKVTVPVGEEPVTVAEHGAEGPTTMEEGHDTFVVVDARAWTA